MNLLFKHKSTYVWKCNVLLSSLKPGDINMSFWRVLNEILKKRCGFSWGIRFIIHMMMMMH